jgi:hypothetical protein
MPKYETGSDWEDKLPKVLMMIIGSVLVIAGLALCFLGRTRPRNTVCIEYDMSEEVELKAHTDYIGESLWWYIGDKAVMMELKR